jgi:high-affinity Fe2+/Pb2+ permease
MILFNAQDMYIELGMMVVAVGLVCYGLYELGSTLWKIWKR